MQTTRHEVLEQMKATQERAIEQLTQIRRGQCMEDYYVLHYPSNGLCVPDPAKSDRRFNCSPMSAARFGFEFQAKEYAQNIRNGRGEKAVPILQTKALEAFIKSIQVSIDELEAM